MLGSGWLAIRDPRVDLPDISVTLLTALWQLAIVVRGITSHLCRRLVCQGAVHCMPTSPLEESAPNGVLAVGKAAGLVDPLTGEGISLALQSGQLAAQRASSALSSGDLSARSLSSNARALSRRHRNRFAQAASLRSKLSDPATVNGLVSLASSVSTTQAGLLSLRRNMLALRLSLRSLPVLGLSPFLALRLFKDQYELI